MHYSFLWGSFVGLCGTGYVIAKAVPGRTLCSWMQGGFQNAIPIDGMEGLVSDSQQKLGFSWTGLFVSTRSVPYLSVLLLLCLSWYCTVLDLNMSAWPNVIGSLVALHGFSCEGLSTIDVQATAWTGFWDRSLLSTNQIFLHNFNWNAH